MPAWQNGCGWPTLVASSPLLADLDLEDSTPPEILDADLAPLALELALWGCPDGADLPWLDEPDAERLAGAVELLLELGAVDERGAVTAEGGLAAGCVPAVLPCPCSCPRPCRARGCLLRHGLQEGG
jgi:hypothetical protein